MATPPVLNFDSLLAPISDAQPTGVNLKNDGEAGELYHKIKRDADSSRTSERLLRVAERNEDGSIKDKIDPPVWPAVVDQSLKVLAEKSKDLWITAWLIEGLTRQKGFAGLRDGFRLVRELAEKYWEGLYPPLDEDDVAEGEYTSVIQLARLVGGDTEGTLVGPVLQIPITSSDKHGEFSSADYLLAEDLERMTDAAARQSRIDAGAVTLPQFESAANDTPAEFYKGLLEDVDACLDEYRKMSDVLSEKCIDPEGNRIAPTVSQMERLIDECRERIKFVGRNVLDTGGEATQEGEAGAAGAGPAAAGGAAGGVMNRETAFRELLKIADFFARTEPHSPLSYALKQIVSWGKMSLPELLSELIEEQATREALFKRTGIPRPEPPPNS